MKCSHVEASGELGRGKLVGVHTPATLHPVWFPVPTVGLYGSIVYVWYCVLAILRGRHYVMLC